MFHALNLPQQAMVVALENFVSSLVGTVEPQRIALESGDGLSEANHLAVAGKLAQQWYQRASNLVPSRPQYWEAVSAVAHQLSLAPPQSRP